MAASTGMGSGEKQVTNGIDCMSTMNYKLFYKISRPHAFARTERDSVIRTPVG